MTRSENRGALAGALICWVIFGLLSLPVSALGAGMESVSDSTPANPDYSFSSSPLSDSLLTSGSPTGRLPAMIVHRLHIHNMIGHPVSSLGSARSARAHGSRLAPKDPAIMTFASKSGGAAVCVGSEETLSDCSYSKVSPEPGAGAGSVTLSDGNVITAFGSSSGLVDCLIPASGAGRCWANSGWPVAEGSSPSAVALPNGNVVVTFSSSSNVVSDCEISGKVSEEKANLPAEGEPIKCGGTGWPAAAQSSPSAVAESSGNVLVTFNSPTSGAANCLIVNGLPYTCNANGGWPVAENSSPSAVALPSGNMMVTFSSSSNVVSDCELTANGGPITCGGTGWPAAAKSSPSAVAESSGHVLVTFNSPTSGPANCLIVNGLPYTCNGSTGWSVAESSSPSAVALPSGNVIVTFSSIGNGGNGVSDCEFTANGEPRTCGNTFWPAAANSSPSAVALSDGHVIVTFNQPQNGASDCLIYSTPINCWGSGIAMASGSSPTAVADGSSVAGTLSFPASGPLPGEATYNWLEQNCEGSAHNCFATNTTPAAGTFGNAKRYDIGTSLPTTDAGEQFGVPGITCTTHSTGECPTSTAAGGEYALAGSNANNLNLNEMMQVTQQSNGLWEFNLGTKNPEDCNATKYAGNCNAMYALFPQRNLSSSEREAGPWNEAFGGNAGSVMLVMSTRQHVLSTNGTFHGFLCVQLQNVATKLQIEDCGETWSNGWPAPRPIAPAQIGCNGGNGALVWSNLGYANKEATSWLSEVESGAASGSTYPNGEATYTYSISRAQLTALLSTLAGQCPAFKGQKTNDYNNWRVLFFEDGYEGGSGVQGADIKFTVSNVHIYTAYQYVVAPPLVSTHAASNIAETSATLNGTVNPEGSEVTKCTFEYGKTTGYGSSVPCAKLPGSGSSPVEVSAALTGLTAGTTYDFRLVATNSHGTENGGNQEFKTSPASSPSYTQTVDSGNSLNAVSCVAGTTDCVASDSKGNAFYATNVSASGAATWKTWTGPATTPSDALNCPTTSLCLIADGSLEGKGGSLYHAGSLGGAWTLAYTPAYGVDAISCVSASFCVAGQDGFGYFRYSTSPASTSWTLEDQGTASMNSVFCLSSSFCAIADSVGTVHIATTTTQTESSAWTTTSVDGTTALHGVACTSTTSCVAVDGAGNVLKLAISEGKAAATKQNIDGTNNLTAITCTSSATCVTVDSVGNIFTTTNGGTNWTKEHATATNLTSVSCASTSLCAAVDTTGKVTTFKP